MKKSDSNRKLELIADTPEPGAVLPDETESISAPEDFTAEIPINVPTRSTSIASITSGASADLREFSVELSLSPSSLPEDPEGCCCYVSQSENREVCHIGCCYFPPLISTLLKQNPRSNWEDVNLNERGDEASTPVWVDLRTRSLLAMPHRVRAYCPSCGNGISSKDLIALEIALNFMNVLVYVGVLTFATNLVLDFFQKYASDGFWTIQSIALSELAVFVLYVASNAYLFYENYEYKDFNDMYFPTIERLSNTKIRLCAKFLYIFGFGRLIQNMFLYNSQSDQDFENHLSIRYYCVWNDVFIWYSPTFLVSSFTVYIEFIYNEFTERSVPQRFLPLFVFLFFFKNLIQFIISQSYLELRNIKHVIVLSLQLFSDISVRVLTTFFMIAHIHPVMGIVLILLCVVFPQYDHELIEQYYGTRKAAFFWSLLLLPANTVSGVLFLYSNSVPKTVVWMEYASRQLLGVCVLLVVWQVKEDISDFLGWTLVACFTSSFVFTVYVSLHQNVYQTQDFIP